MKFIYRTWRNGEQQFSPVIEMSQEDMDRDDTQSWVTMRVFDSKEDAEAFLAEEQEFYAGELDAELSAYECNGEE